MNPNQTYYTSEAINNIIFVGDYFNFNWFDWIALVFNNLQVNYSDCLRWDVEYILYTQNSPSSIRSEFWVAIDSNKFAIYYYWCRTFSIYNNFRKNMTWTCLIARYTNSLCFNCKFRKILWFFSHWRLWSRFKTMHLSLLWNNWHQCKFHAFYLHAD